jgi:nucleoporin GLE1
MLAARFYAPFEDGASDQDNTLDVASFRCGGAAPSFSLCMPTDSNSSDDESTLGISKGPLSPPISSHFDRRSAIASVALADAAQLQEAQLQLQTHHRVSQFQDALLQIETEERRISHDAAGRFAAETRAFAAEDAQAESQRLAHRDSLLKSLRQSQEQMAALAARKKAEAEAISRRQAEEATQRQEAAAKAEEEQRQQKAEHARRVAESETAAQAAKEAAERQKMVLKQHDKKSSDSISGLASTSDAILSVAATAAKFQQSCAEKLAAAQATVKPFVEDRAMRDIKRSIDKFVTLNVQQISATLEQVQLKAQALAAFVAQHKQVQRTYALLTLAGKLLSQCEVQITRLHSFAFPLAEVAVAVAAAHPDFAHLLLGRLHAVCPLTIPLYWGYRAGGSEPQYLALLGYKPGDSGNNESTDEYVARMQGYVMFYAAFTQSDNPMNPHGLQFAWAYIARLLNSLPPTRITAAALDAFLKVSGYRLAAAYRRQFAKLLEAIQRDFLKELEEHADPDARAVCTRLRTYLQTRQYMSPPEGRNMPRQDASTYERA